MDPLLYQAAAQIPQEQRHALYQLATAPAEPQALARRMYQGMTLVAVLLLGAGLIFWIAANWQAQPRLFKLGLLESVLALCVLAACLSPRARIPGLFAANLVLGGLLAFIGQTYQTGADAWQLFAAWAALSLIWTILARSDVLWTLWVLVAAAGLVLRQGAQTDWIFFLDDSALPPLALLRDMLPWLLLAILPGLISLIPRLQLPQGLGVWSHRTAMALALVAWVPYTFVTSSLPSLLAMALIAAVLCSALRGPWKDFPVLCLAALAANAVVLRLVVEQLDSAMSASNHIESLMFSIFLVGVLCLGGTIVGLTRAHRALFRPSTSEEQPA